MTIDDYLKAVLATRVYPRIERIRPGSIRFLLDGSTAVEHEILPVYPALAICGEAGEYEEKRSAQSGFEADEVLELGDVLWYAGAAALDLDVVLAAEWPLVANGVRAAATANLIIPCGRFAEQVKKAWRDHTPLDVGEAAIRLRVILDSIALAASRYRLTLADVAERNAKKVLDRRARGVTAGSGDRR